MKQNNGLEIIFNLHLHRNVKRNHARSLNKTLSCWLFLIIAWYAPHPPPQKNNGPSLRVNFTDKSKHYKYPLVISSHTFISLNDRLGWALPKEISQLIYVKFSFIYIAVLIHLSCLKETVEIINQLDSKIN